MKWFKHMTDAGRDEAMSNFMDEFGLEGYGFWWLILEIVASQMDGTSRCHAEYSVKQWGRMCRMKSDKFIKCASNLSHLGKIRLTFVEQKCIIEVPNLLKIRDNYTKDLEVTSKKLPSIEVEVEVEKTLSLSSAEEASDKDVVCVGLFLREESVSNPMPLKDSNTLPVKKRKTKPELSEIPFEEIITDLNMRTGKDYRHSSKATRESIRARWAEGYRLADFQKVHEIKAAEWKGTENEKYLNPDTLYRPSKFEKYLNQGDGAGRHAGPLAWLKEMREKEGEGNDQSGLGTICDVTGRAV